MKSLKSLYLRNLLLDLYRRRIAVICFTVLCMAGFTFWGYKKSGPTAAPSPEELQELDSYNAKLTEYEEALKNIQDSLVLAKTQAEEQQRYVDESVYMNLDAQNIHVASAQYSIETEGNLGNILSAFVFYINEGGLKEDSADEYDDLSVKYWREIITCNTSGNILSLTVSHYDAQQAKKILDAVHYKLTHYAREVVKTQGEFVLTRIESATYVRADAGVTTNQNNNLNTLKSYLTNVADYENRVVSQTNTIENFKKEAPDFFQQPTGAKKDILKHTLMGVIFGLIVSCAILALQYVLDNRIRNKDDLAESSLNVLGSYRVKDKEQKDMDRASIGVQLLAKQQNISSIFLDALSDDDLSKSVTQTFSQAISKGVLTTKDGFHVYEDGRELKDLVECQFTIFIVQAGKTTYKQLEQHIMLCHRFSVTILGCIVIE